MTKKKIMEKYELVVGALQDSIQENNELRKIAKNEKQLIKGLESLEFFVGILLKKGKNE